MGGDERPSDERDRPATAADVERILRRLEELERVLRQQGSAPPITFTNSPIHNLAIGGQLGVAPEPAPLPKALPPEPFVPTPYQRSILEALEGRALKTDALGRAVGDRGRLYKPGGLKELQERGAVRLHRRLGHYRPDAPPPELESLPKPDQE